MHAGVHIYELGSRGGDDPSAECFQAALMFARTQGIGGPRADPRHRGRDPEANRCKESGESRTIPPRSAATALDMAAYEAYLAGTMQDLDFPRRAARGDGRRTGARDA